MPGRVGDSVSFRDVTASVPRSVRALVVLYEHDIEVVERAATALAASARVAIESGLLQTLHLALGDCSDEPLDRDAVLAATGHEGIASATYTHFGQNLGSAGGNRALAVDASEDALLVLNPDATVAPASLAALLVALTEDVGIAEARQIPFEHPKDYDTVSGETSWASGFGQLVNRAAYESIGGHDTAHFFLHCDDVDLSWRMRLAGWRVVHVPGAPVFHAKRLDEGGVVSASETEEFWALLGRMMLCRRYGAIEEADKTANWVEHNGSAAQQNALAEYRARESDGRVPAPEAGAEQVASFVDGTYGRHRF